jgi:hypothetical protein
VGQHYSLLCDRSGLLRVRLTPCTLMHAFIDTSVLPHCSSVSSLDQHTIDCVPECVFSEFEMLGGGGGLPPPPPPTTTTTHTHTHTLTQPRVTDSLYTTHHFAFLPGMGREYQGSGSTPTRVVCTSLTVTARSPLVMTSAPSPKSSSRACRPTFTWS